MDKQLTIHKDTTNALVKKEQQHNIFKIQSKISFEFLQESKTQFNLNLDRKEMIKEFFMEIASIDSFHVLNPNFVWAVIVTYFIKILTNQKFNLTYLLLSYLLFSLLFAVDMVKEALQEYAIKLDSIKKSTDTESCLINMTDFLRDEFFFKQFVKKNGERNYVLLVLQNIMAMQDVTVLPNNKKSKAELIYDRGLFVLKINGIEFYARTVTTNNKDACNVIEFGSEKLEFRFLEEDLFTFSGGLQFSESLFM